ncbi:hypothetical protein DWY35_06210 [Ruminococcus sp. AF25-13]|jgi:hypothetical protein|nr:hypothetical protein DXD07_00540 [Ruminococcus sp. TF10-6]RGF28147.1 hypothetical protein DW106_07855 [Ruminococcus sp. AM09-18-1]RGF73290.1 hypothetical protein DWZ26_10510 [Ruminococcus sp. AF31-14BH]RGG29838.1 hypothetical protein DWY35_06210 [Ruminococcus sp. AF25-13]RGG41056.1 hypothetical protein DWY13_01055 [Ruminococcus sp. AF24-16]RGG55364.1 hypothetical protein DWX54_09730 [Ruminococcus sp. AF19-4LB]RGH17844.1 hypothetical protein DWV75_07020 [Ruminococcus sp. AF12-5]RGH42667.1 
MQEEQEKQVQLPDPLTVPLTRRYPVLADIFNRLGYMERKSSGSGKIIGGSLGMSLRKNGYDVRNKFQDCKTSYQRYRYCPIYWSWFQWTLGNN